MPAKPCYDGGTCRNYDLVDDLELEIIEFEKAKVALAAERDRLQAENEHLKVLGDFRHLYPLIDKLDAMGFGSPETGCNTFRCMVDQLIEKHDRMQAENEQLRGLLDGAKRYVERWSDYMVEFEPDQAETGWALWIKIKEALNEL